MPEGKVRVRMSGHRRREQLLDVGRSLFAEKGFDGTSIEEIAARAGVSKPVVYEHFGGKEGLYAVVVDREVTELMRRLTDGLSSTGHPRRLAEQATLALLTYIQDHADGFRVLSRDSATGTSGTFGSLLNDIAQRVELILGAEFERVGMPVHAAPLYAQMLVGMVAFTGLWWQAEGGMDRQEVAAHIVNLGWHGLRNLEPAPRLVTLHPPHLPPDR